MELLLERPIVFFDLETTGTNVTKDRIVEFSYIKVYPGGEKEEKAQRVNPGMKIPAASTAIHHITNEDVANCPTFADLADDLYKVFEDSDIAGFNSNKFDVPLLMEEFARVGKNFDVASRKFIDVQNIFHQMEKRTLVAAYKFYCGKDLEGAHSALADTRATYEVLLGQLDRYPQLKNDVKSLAQFSSGGNNVDLAGRIVYNEKGVPVLNFGKNKGRSIEELVRYEPSFIDWMLQNDFPKNTKDILLAIRYKVLNK